MTLLFCENSKKKMIHLKDFKETIDKRISLIANEDDALACINMLKNLENEIASFEDECLVFLPIKEKSSKGELIEFNIMKELKYWQKFYEKQGVNWAALPERIKITLEQKNEIKRLIREFGFDKMLIIPEGLADSGDKYEKLYMAMTEGYSKENLTTEDEKRKEMHDCMSDKFKQDGGFAELKNKSNKLRIILTKDAKELGNNELLKSTLGKSVDDLEKGIFAEKNIRGLDMAAYLALQREYFKRTGEHMDSAYYYVWLTETIPPPVSGHVPYVDWHAGDDRLYVRSNTADYHDGIIGCRLAGSFLPAEALAKAGEVV